jgi:hypothetical protein
MHYNAVFGERIKRKTGKALNAETQRALRKDLRKTGKKK